ncbi:FAD/NAD(P)-binding oxidoreductase, partial [Desulfovibrio desulfuricans]|nr:FAD/NAD(P)-binding oxidoreductase [Desulfovibrio desulfuricans]
KKEMPVVRNEKFQPVRKAIPVLRAMPKEKRDAMIKQNPDYGVIVCRCEEISKGEILDALKSPIAVPTV